LRVPNKDLMKKLNILEKEIGEIKKGSKKQMDVAVISLAAAYILLGVSMMEYVSWVKSVISLALIIIGLLVILYIYESAVWKKEKP